MSGKRNAVTNQFRLSSIGCLNFPIYQDFQLRYTLESTAREAGQGTCLRFRPTAVQFGQSTTLAVGKTTEPGIPLRIRIERTIDLGVNSYECWFHHRIVRFR